MCTVKMCGVDYVVGTDVPEVSYPCSKEFKDCSSTLDNSPTTKMLTPNTTLNLVERLLHSLDAQTMHLCC